MARDFIRMDAYMNAHDAEIGGAASDFRSVEELTFYMRTVEEMATNDWATSFAASINKQSQRPNWRPSRKQEEIMRLLVRDLFAHFDECELQKYEVIER